MQIEMHCMETNACLQIKFFMINSMTIAGLRFQFKMPKTSILVQSCVCDSFRFLSKKLCEWWSAASRDAAHALFRFLSFFLPPVCYVLYRCSTVSRCVVNDSRNIFSIVCTISSVKFHWNLLLHSFHYEWFSIKVAIQLTIQAEFVITETCHG